MSDPWNKKYMTELVRLDIDLPAIPRWKVMALSMPEIADALVKQYGTKQDRKQLRELSSSSKPHLSKPPNPQTVY